mgnify:CR=1 FL=1
MKYLIFTTKPQDFKLIDGSFLSAMPCVEGFFILNSQLEDSKLAGWAGGAESNSITQAEPTPGI